jgi:hypothetical protein
VRLRPNLDLNLSPNLNLNLNLNLFLFQKPSQKPIALSFASKSVSDLVLNLNLNLSLFLLRWHPPGSLWAAHSPAELWFQPCLTATYGLSEPGYSRVRNRLLYHRDLF